MGKIGPILPYVVDQIREQGDKIDFSGGLCPRNPACEFQGCLDHGLHFLDQCLQAYAIVGFVVVGDQLIPSFVENPQLVEAVTAARAAE